MTDEFPEYPSVRGPWLMTLADLALLLVGFLVLLQATQVDRGRLAAGLRGAFRADTAMPVEAAGVDFAPASSTPDDTAPLTAWARNAARDPRVAFAVTASTDGSRVDVDRASGSAALLAADRARAVAAALAAAAPGRRLSIATTTQPGRRTALVTLGFAGEPRSTR